MVARNSPLSVFHSFSRSNIDLSESHNGPPKKTTAAKPKTKKTAAAGEPPTETAEAAKKRVHRKAACPMRMACRASHHSPHAVLDHDM